MSTESDFKFLRIHPFLSVRVDSLEDVDVVNCHLKAHHAFILPKNGQKWTEEHQTSFVRKVNN